MALWVALWVLSGLFLGSAIVQTAFRRSRPGLARAQDRGSLALIWVAITLGVGGAIAAEWAPIGRVSFYGTGLRLVAVGLLAMGLAFRWWAIITLGRFFTADVAIQRQHLVVDRGPFRLVRHPSYAGSLVAFIGIGLSMASWLSFVILLVPITLAFLYRISVEERALRAALGTPYAEYAARTKRLIPGVY